MARGRVKHPAKLKISDFLFRPLARSPAKPAPRTRAEKQKWIAESKQLWAAALGVKIK